MDIMIDHIVELSNAIYSELGSGFAENIYQKALFYELIDNGYSVELEKIIPITYKNYNVGIGRIDLFIKNQDNIYLIIELKAITGSIGCKELTQLKTYCKNIDKEGCGGIIINFPQPGTKLNKNDIEILKL